MKHVKTVTRLPRPASDTVNTISESKIETKESFINGKVG